MPVGSESTIPDALETEIKAEVCGELDPAPAPPSVLAAPPEPAPPPAAKRRFAWLPDVVLFLMLCLAAFPIRWAATTGDLWFDEADYAQAAARGFEANRWDRSEVAADPEKLVRLRHYHPPLVAQVLIPFALQGAEERSLRLPFVLVGCVTVGVVYLCGLLLFRSRSPGGETRPLRAAALAAAIILLFTPAHVRASSHAIPWAWITLWLTALLGTLLGHARRPHAAWLAASGVVLGGMAVTSEYLFPTLVAYGAALLVLFARDYRKRPGWAREAVVGLGAGALGFAVVGWIFWPAGATGGATKMLQHYVEMADSVHFPVVIDGQVYQRAPKWAYLYWYWYEYPAYAALYAAGLASLLVLAVRRALDVRVALVALFAGLIVAVAHRSHIIGPEYLVHALPFLTLLGVLPLAAMERARPVHSLPALVACCWVIASAPELEPLAGMDARSRLSRWPAAAAFLKERAAPEDLLLSSSYAVSARWYLLHQARLPLKEEQIRILPASEARDELIRELKEGCYRWIVVGNSLTDWTPVDNRIRMLLQRWRVVWKSDEGGTGPSRLVIYERPEPPAPLFPWLPIS